ncbi:hypothetical protein IFM12275_23630 [Nocardia sputorum]|uniref:hypothetical protein n=1 Tax=Nocardia sputorum TaxID=2984338 RepID=UPI00249015D1|nr:hypothetical protein [Nocardia sputorum]BDT92387.1 hypothetical protein IFM12275_23630 [Nocardia sputorum]
MLSEDPCREQRKQVIEDAQKILDEKLSHLSDIAMLAENPDAAAQESGAGNPIAVQLSEALQAGLSMVLTIQEIIDAAYGNGATKAAELPDRSDGFR